MRKHSVFVKNPGASGWEHWGWFDTRRDAREECARQKSACSSVRTRIVHTNTSTDFAAMAATMSRLTLLPAAGDRHDQ